MKTNVTLQSSDRELFGIKIRQETKNGLLSVTDLQNAYEIARWQYGWGERRISDIIKSNQFSERVYYLLEGKGIIKTTLSVFIEMVEKEGIVKVLKGLRVWKKTGARGTDNVLCDPYIWVLLAMEMNPMIYARVVIWLTDSLIFDRIEAGDGYIEMNKAISKIIQTPSYSEIAKAINLRVFGHHEAGMRQLASKNQLKKIADIEKFIQNAINNDLIHTGKQIYTSIEKYR